MAPSNKTKDVTLKKVLGEINLTEEDLEEAVATMKLWIRRRPHLPAAASDECLLKCFIISCKSLNLVKMKLDNYFTFRTTFKKQCFRNRDPLAIDWTKATEKIVMLPGLTPSGHKVCLLVVPRKDQLPPYDVEETSKIFFMLMDSYLPEVCMSSGLLMVYDMSHITHEFIEKKYVEITSANCKVLGGAFPHRVEGIYYFNSSAATEAFLDKCIRPFLDDENLRKVQVYAEDHTVLRKYLPLEMLPRDYEAGNNPSLQMLWDDLRTRLESERDWFLEDGSQTVNEALRRKNI